MYPRQTEDLSAAGFRQKERIMESSQERPLPRHKGMYILPNLFTTASLFAAFLGILYSAKGDFNACALAILLSAIMDGLDGKVARLTNSASEFGVQYDSLADLVAFGLTPSFMIYQYALVEYNRIGIGACFLFTMCAALRLARFNITTTATNKRFFSGLPTPAAGCTLALLMLFLPSMPDVFIRNFTPVAFIFTVGLAFLMVSNIRYSSFKEFGFVKAHPYRTMVSVCIIFALIITNIKVFGFLLMLGYLFSGLISTYIILPRRARLANRHEPHPEGKR